MQCPQELQTSHIALPTVTFLRGRGTMVEIDNSTVPSYIVHYTCCGAVTMANVVAAKRLRKEFQLLEKEPEHGIWAAPNEKDVLKWEFVIRGSDDTPYEARAIRNIPATLHLACFTTCVTFKRNV